MNNIKDIYVFLCNMTNDAMTLWQIKWNMKLQRSTKMRIINISIKIDKEYIVTYLHIFPYSSKFFSALWVPFIKWHSELEIKYLFAKIRKLNNDIRLNAIFTSPDRKSAKVNNRLDAIFYIIKYIDTKKNDMHLFKVKKLQCCNKSKLFNSLF